MVINANNAIEDTDVHKMVREAYANRVKQEGKSCCCKSKAPPSCCSSNKVVPSADTSRSAETMGYSADDVKNAPEGSNLGLGCGAPLTQAGVKEGDVVLDLGSGAGFDSFLATKIVKESGRVIGVDFTPEMVETARSKAKKHGYTNVDFRVGHIEALPVDDSSVDVIISNCVINLSPDKPAVFREAFRVLKPGGRIAVSDICLTAPLPEPIRNNLAAYVGCIAGASLLEDYKQIMRDAGFTKVEATTRGAFDVLAADDPVVLGAIEGVEKESNGQAEIERAKASVVSASIVGHKE